MREETSFHYFLLCWNVGALLCLLTPLLIRFISFVSYKLVSKNNNGNQSSWWPWQNNNSQWELGNGVVIFVSIWSFAIFAFLVWYGNMIFRKPANPLPLLSALVMHANLSLMCGLLVFCLEVSLLQPKDTKDQASSMLYSLLQKFDLTKAKCIIIVLSYSGKWRSGLVIYI
jgi:hypothetical protein